jgi:hypothetical protein
MLSMVKGSTLCTVNAHGSSIGCCMRKYDIQGLVRSIGVMVILLFGVVECFKRGVFKPGSQLNPPQGEKDL